VINELLEKDPTITKVNDVEINFGDKNTDGDRKAIDKVSDLLHTKQRGPSTAAMS